MAVTLGSERLLSSGMLTGWRVGVVSNPASVDGAFRHVVDRVAEQPGVVLAALFGPQHGFHADVQDNMVETGHARHPRLDVRSTRCTATRGSRRRRCSTASTCW